MSRSASQRPRRRLGKGRRLLGLEVRRHQPRSREHRGTDRTTRHDILPGVGGPIPTGNLDRSYRRRHAQFRPLAGATLLHICVEFDELAIAEWLLDRGMNVDVRAAVNTEGFGGHTALFGAVVSYPHFWMNYTGGWAHSRKPRQAAFAQLLLDRGADPNARASLRETNYDRHLGQNGTPHRDVTPLGWGDAFSTRIVVSEPAMKLIASRGGER